MGDGAPLSDSEDLDGVPLDGAALLRSAVKLKSSSPIRAFVHKTSKYDADVDGVPMSDDLDGVPLYPSSSPSIRSSSTHKQLVKATTSKWESEAPVLASSKWDHPDLESDHQYDHTSHRNEDRRTADKSDRPPRDKERSERHKEKDKRKSTSRSRSRSRSPKKSSRSKRGRSRSASPARAVRKSPRS